SALGAIRDRAPGICIGQRVALEDEPRAGEEQAPLVRKVGIERVALHARALGDHAHRGVRRADGAVEVDRRLDDPSPGLRLLLGAAFQRVGTGHDILLHIIVHPLLTRDPNSITHICIMKLRWRPRRSGAPGPFQETETETWKRRSRKSDRKSTRLNSSHVKISYAVFCLKKK